MDIYLLLQIVGGAPLPKPMHFLYAAPCPWCSKTILSTRLIWLIWSSWSMTVGSLNGKSDWLQRSLSFRCILRYWFFWIFLVYICESVLGYYSSLPFFILFNGSFDVWIVNFCLRCFWGALSSSLLISRCSSTTPFYRSEQHQTCWKLSGNSSTLLNMYMCKWCSTQKQQVCMQ